MDRAGGYLALIALEENAERYEQLRDVLLQGGAGIPAALAKLERLEAAINAPHAPTFGRFEGEPDLIVHDVATYLRTGRTLQAVR